jgi:hypothetical protein
LPAIVTFEGFDLIDELLGLFEVFDDRFAQ